MSTSSSVLQIGRQRIHVLGNLAEVAIVGTITGEELKELFAFYDRVIAEHGHVCMLADMTRTDGIGPKARVIIAEWASRNSKNFHCALYGTSRPARAILTLLVGAIRMLSSRPPDVAFFESADEARRWLAPYVVTPSHPDLPAAR